ncbi:MAG: hypothetical protein KF760_35375 [Candidatus Eremiobacteraeota bacterium]|nr:hypothetical protein [Candidatus Eremiobacteraeota bacterium]MCW5871133.1 hypothetical protein [Candidatus Eremiobacteraeota bacterium]
MVIAVFGTGSDLEPYCGYAAAAGAAIARAGHDLLTGGRSGAMRAALSGYHSAGGSGQTLAVLPAGVEPLGDYQVVLRTNLPAPKRFEFDRFSRNYINARICDAAVAVSPTGGTVTEIAWMLRLGKPCCFYGSLADLDLARRSLREFPVEGPLPQLSPGEDFQAFLGSLG